jgi:hypothetical protein
MAGGLEKKEDVWISLPYRIDSNRWLPPKPLDAMEPRQINVAVATKTLFHARFKRTTAICSVTITIHTMLMSSPESSLRVSIPTITP